MKTFRILFSTLTMLLAASVAYGDGYERPLPGRGECSQPPSFAGVRIAPDVIVVRNNKDVAVELTGNVAQPGGCTSGNTWYVLTDEYGELNTTEPVVVDVDGSFSATISVKAYRKGSDKDGRQYTVSVYSANEAGTAGGGAFRVTVAHDNR